MALGVRKSTPPLHGRNEELCESEGRLPPNASKERKSVTEVGPTSTRSRDHRLAERNLTRSLRYDQHRSNNRIVIDEGAEKWSHRPFDHTQTHAGIE
ncbi:hypothetical protein Syun_012005 [Stephania yunnanensis]|uniref:Uncharacterized protein n=1 Tax=Stephania yunnanensis TaxID=152371 RepID=A0AAP0K0W4_9MAGN